MPVHQDSTEEKPSKISNITFAILPFNRKNTQTESEWSSWVLCNLLLLMKQSDALQIIVHFNIKNEKSRVG